MSLARRVRVMERRAGELSRRACRCSMPILVSDSRGVRRVFHNLRDFYAGTVQGEPLELPPLRADGTVEPIPERCGQCGGIIQYVRVAVP
jgi:hypothetical protein